MKYGNVQNYIEAVEGLNARLRGRMKLVPIRGEDKMLRYKINKGVICFDLIDNRGLYLFLNEEAFERFKSKNPKVDIFYSELFVSFDDDNGFWTDFVVGGLCAQPVVEDKKEVQRVFFEGLRAIEVDSKWGFENRDGRIVIEAVWDYVEDFSEGRAVVCKDDLYGLIDDAGKAIVDAIYDELSWDGSNYAYGETMGQWGVVDRSGNIVVEFKWEWVGEFSYGYAIVQKDQKNGFVNKSGDVVIQPIYDQATSFNEFGVASVMCGENEFFIDTRDRRV